MARQNISIGSSANDGTGDTLRSAGNKINQNFQEIYTQLGGDSSTLTTQVILKDSGGVGTIIFEGTSADSHETKLIATDPTTEKDVEKFCEYLNHELVSIKVSDGLLEFKVKKNS